MHYKECADKRRSEGSAAELGVVQEKVTEILIYDSNNYYTCSTCNRRFKPQDITVHLESCAKNWRKGHKTK